MYKEKITSETHSYPGNILLLPCQEIWIVRWSKAFPLSMRGISLK